MCWTRRSLHVWSCLYLRFTEQYVCVSAATGVSSIFSLPVWTLLSSHFPRGSWDWRQSPTPSIKKGIVMPILMAHSWINITADNQILISNIKWKLDLTYIAAPLKPIYCVSDLFVAAKREAIVKHTTMFLPHSRVVYISKSTLFPNVCFPLNLFEVYFIFPER